jgi:flagellar assembly protein FliH
MSRVLREERARLAASLGSFVVRRTDPTFHPLGTSEPYNDDGLKPLSAEQERLRAQAEAYAKGYDEARRALEAEVAGEREAIARLAASLEGLRPDSGHALALLLAETVDRLVREIIGTVEIDATLLLARAKAAADLIDDNVEPSRLIVHPDDIPLLEPAGLALELTGDPTLVRGTVVLETGHGWVEDGPAVRLERLRVELDKMAARR